MWVGRGEVPTDGVTVKRVKKGRGGDCQRFITPLPQGRTLSLFNRGSKLIDTICQAALLVLQLCEALGGWQGDGRGGNTLCMYRPPFPQWNTRDLWTDREMQAVSFQQGESQETIFSRLGCRRFWGRGTKNVFPGVGLKGKYYLPAAAIISSSAVMTAGLERKNLPLRSPT